MSKLNDLIRELCPNGVIYKRIEEFAECVAGATPSKSEESYWLGGTIPWMSSGEVNKKEIYDTDNKITQKGYDNTSTKMIPANSVVMALAGQGKTRGMVAITRIELCTNQSLCAFVADKTIIPEYLYYFLSSRYKELRALSNGDKDGARGGLNLKILRKFVVPVPPLDVQREIVRVLDSFSLLTTELTTRLTAELTTREKQYDYYRDYLIDNPAGEVQVKKMGDVLTFLNGRAYKQAELLGQGKYPVLRVGNFYTNESWYYSDLELDSSKYCDYGDLLYSWAATLGPKIWEGHKCIYHYHIWKILFSEDEIDKQYLYYYLQYDLKKISESTTKSTMIHVSMGSMKERSIILPEIEEQRRIASLISKYDMLRCDIKNGLSSEVEFREKQYEYYRDRLLSFKQIGA